MVKALGILLLVFACQNAYSSSCSDSSAYRRIAKLDIVPLYHLLFDVRKQLRMGLEYEQEVNNRFFATLHLDAGLYDHYSYTKYYDFFSQDGGMYHTRQLVRTFGFHLLPSYNYFLSDNTRKKRTRCYTGFTIDFNRFFKRIDYSDSRTPDKSRSLSAQTKIGAGLALGLRYRIRSRCSLDLKGIIISRIASIDSQPGMKDIKPYKAVWFDKDMRFWFIPDIQVCYAF